MIRADIYRTCRYKNEDYLFHCFEQWSNVIGESVAVGGHSAGQISLVFALIEDERGRIKRVDPTMITFTDNEFKDYFLRAKERIRER
jgi:hypothetical protein